MTRYAALARLVRTYGTEADLNYLRRIDDLAERAENDGYIHCRHHDEAFAPDETRAGSCPRCVAYADRRDPRGSRADRAYEQAREGV